jgi:superfamily I DNA/RNA helicase
MPYPPTAEQQSAIDAFTTNGDLVIQAGAGTGKTSTLRMLAESQPYRRGLYVAYNRAIAHDAARTFPRQTSCSTAHSLAFRAVGHQFKHRLDAPRQPARIVAELLGITGQHQLGTDVPILAPQQVARIVNATVDRFCRTADHLLDAHHVPQVNGFTTGAAETALAQLITPLARKAWDDLTTHNGRLKFQHDHYLKIWQLSYPRLPCDYLLLDEAQDADPVIASIVGNQQCQRIAVGDAAQAIYAWRGAIDVMSKWPGTQVQLSRSFRFGPAVADEANRWLQILESSLRLTGHDPIHSRLAPLAEPDAILCRSNAGAIREVMISLTQGRRTALVGGGEQIRKLAAAAVTLKAGLGTDHPELFAFRTWTEVQDYVQQDDAGADLKTFVDLIDDYGPDSIMAALDQLVDEPGQSRGPMALAVDAEVTVSTAHKAKGREWPTVRISDDFYEPKTLTDGTQAYVDPAEARLAYVAVTRARDTLDRGSLRWIDTYQPGPRLRQDYDR